MTEYASNKLSSEVSFPNIKNNYKGGAVEPFSLPVDMPPHAVFDDITVTPVPVVSLKTKRLSNNQKVFINLVQHEDIPCSFDTSKPFLFLTNEASFELKEDEGLVFDVAFHPSLMTSVPDEVAGRAVLQVQERLGDELDKGYKTPKTRNNYKCADIVFTVAPALISGTDIAKTKLVAGAFEGEVTVSSKIFAVVAENEEKQKEKEVRRSSVDGQGGSSRQTFADKTAPRRGSSDSSTVNAAPRRGSSDRSTANAASVPVVGNSSVSRHEDHEKWKSFLTAGEEIMATQLVVKPNPYGLGHKRQLILTSTPRLIYVDPSKMELKGEVEWTKDSPPTIYAVNKETFELVVSKRNYKFVDKANGADYWVKQVTGAIQLLG